MSRAKVLGFCHGVDYAISKLDEALDGEGRPVYTLGPIIHNPQVLEGYRKKGVRILWGDEALPEGASVVVRAHGVPPQVKKGLQEQRILVKDGTCPKVIASQGKVAKYAADGYTIVIVGDPCHSEVKGLMGYAPAPVVLQNPEEAEKVELQGRVMVIAQTTIQQQEYDAVCDVLRPKGGNLHIINSICSATTKRQDALLELCQKVECCLIIGGKESANTERLFRSAQKTGIPCWHIEGARDIPREVENYRRVGISAGASTPEGVVQGVERALWEGSYV